MADNKADLAGQFQSVSDLYDGAGLVDPFPMYVYLREKTPVAEGDILARYGAPQQGDATQSGRPIVTVYRHADVAEVLRNQVDWSSALLMEGLGSFLGDIMLTGLGGDAHRKMRGLLQPWFSPASLKKFNDSVIVPLVRDRFIAPLYAKGRMDLVGNLALPYPIHVVYGMMGFPDNAAMVERFAGQALTILASLTGDPDKLEQARIDAFQAAQDLYDDIKPIIAARRADGAAGDDLIAFLLRAEFEGLKLDDHQIANVVRMLLPAAAETTTRTLANLMVVLFAHPETLARVRADRTLVPKAMNESMRFDPVAGYLARQATRDVTLSDVTIAAGMAASVSISSAHRDPRVFENPDTFDIDRPAKVNLGFGYGIHLCLGMPVAKLEIEAAVNALLDLPNLRLDPDMPPPQVRGITMRGPDAVHIVWDA
jgi:cytochrome P450